MSRRPLDAAEREQLCDLFLDLGPDAPTLCEGWATLDLAAHLVVRERDPRSGLFILTPPGRFDGLEGKVMGRARDAGYERLVARLRQGPPPVPWKVPGLRTPLNLNEWFVHHEDTRRANGLGPRQDVDGLEPALWTLLGRTSRLMVRGLKGTGLTVVAPGFGSRAIHKGDPMATLTGSPQELVLYLNGRGSAAEVALDGPPAALDALAQARLGI